MSADAASATPPWHAAYPKPSNPAPAAVTAEEIRRRFDDGNLPGKTYLLVDLRRNDHEGGTIHRSINLPAQSLYPSLPALYDVVAAGGVTEVIFYCVSSRGRGTRAAGWFEDHIKSRGDSSLKSLVLEGGIAGWVGAGSEYTRWMDGYDEKVWTKQ